MAIEIECPQCAMRYAAPDRLAGSQVKCPECGAQISVPAASQDTEAPAPAAPPPRKPKPQKPKAKKPPPKPKPKPSGSLGDLLDEELAAGSAAEVPGPLADDLPASAAGPALPGGPLPGGGSVGGTLPPMKRKRARSDNGSGTFLELVRTHTLASVLALVVPLAFLFNLVFTNFWIAAIALVAGGLIALVGFKSDSSRPLFEKPDLSQEGGGCAVCATMYFIVGASFRVIRRLADSSGESGPPTALAVVGGLFALALAVTAFVLMFRIFARMFGGFRVAAATYLTLGMMHVMLASAGLGSLGMANWMASRDSSPPVPPASTDEVEVPPMPNRPRPQTIRAGVELAKVRLNVPSGQPGYESRLYTYTPAGNHRPKSLSCVLIAPAGTNLLSGMALGSGDQPEHIPYVQAGIAVVAYEIDGTYPSRDPTIPQARQALKHYVAADAGMINARNALEFVLARMPEVDPERIYAAGHSSAATLALLFAQREKRLGGCIAFAPAIRLRERFGADLPAIEQELPGATEVIGRYTPDASAWPAETPLLLFHAEDDSNVPVEDSKGFASRLQRGGRQVTLVTVPRGDHYDSMIDEGIPRAIAWIKARQPESPYPGPDVPDKQPKPEEIASNERPKPSPPRETPDPRPVAPPTKPTVDPVRPKPPGPEVRPEPKPQPKPQPREEPLPADPVAASLQYVERFYVETLAAGDTTVLGMVQWLPAAKRPVLGLRWGVGLQKLGSTAQPAADSLTAMARLTGPVGPALVALLQRQMADGGFGVWPEQGPERLREVALLGSGRQAELLDAAQRRGLDLLVVFNVSERVIAVSRRKQITLRARIIDVVTGKQLWTSGSVNAQSAAAALAVRQTSQQIEEQFRLVPMPDIKPEHAKQRLTALAAGASKLDSQQALRVMLELRYYQAKRLLQPADVTPVYEAILGSGRGQAMATGSSTQRRELLRGWLEQAR